MATYVRRNGEKLGPFEDAQLLSSLQQGMFSYDDLALRDGWTDWKPLRTLFAPPAPAPAVTRPAAEEQRMWSGKPSHWNFFFSWLLALVFVGAGAFCLWIYFNGGANPLLLIPGAIAILILLYIYISRARQRYIVTNRKVEIQTGLVIKSTNEIRVKDIRSINVTKHGLAGFIGIGSVEFSSAATDRAEVIFVNIAHADRVRDLVTNLQET
ncbi:MAG TPA: PH domain-containing protein [Candidatus Binatia bacterium]|jgi:membrane protein YdbS with pleckstrin-like domain|nr:PH domain-containing protein [Candidatus Binatia bacterium]